MKNKLIGIIICMLLIGTVLPVTGTVIKTNNTASSSMSGNTLYVGGTGDGNYTKIQDAINDSVDGDTVFVYDDSSPYYESVTVDKQINLIGENRETTVIDGFESLHVVYVANRVNISGFTIQNGDIGIDIFNLGHTVTGNTISNNRYGIRLGYSSGNIISDNSFFNDGLFVYDSYDNNIENNMVNGKPLVYLEDESDKVIDYEVGQVILVNCNKITVENLYLSNTDVGIELWKTDNSMIRNNDISNNMLGLCLLFSSGNTLTGNTIISNNGYGIYLTSYSDNNTIKGNTISNNNRHGIYSILSCDSNTITGNTITSNSEEGIYLSNSDSNTIKGNTISNNEDGIYLVFSSGNTFTGNTIISNNEDGIYFDFSKSNTIKGNTISNNNCHGIYSIHSHDSSTITGNTISNNEYGINLSNSDSNTIKGNTISNNDYGIYLWWSSNSNIIYHNNFINNDLNAYDECDNIWDDGKYGNYWSDYEERYPDAKPLLFKPWMWDTPYEINGGNKDNCPLIEPWPKSKPRTIQKDIASYSSYLLSFLEQFPMLRYLLRL